MNITHKKNSYTFDLSHGAPSLLEQLDSALPASVIQRAAKDASGLLEYYAHQSAEAQAAAVASLSVGALGSLNENDSESLAVVMTAAALLVAAKHGRGTPSERIRQASVLLSDRYQSDW